VSAALPAFPEDPDPIRAWSRWDPGRIALVDRAKDRRLTYRELDADADRWAAILTSAGAGRGDRVALLSGNRVEAVALLFACGRIGAALVPLNWRLASRELAPILRNAGAVVLATESGFRAQAEAVSAEVEQPPAWIDLDAPPLLRRIEIARAPIDPEDAALVLYTSGSTGMPKGAVLPHRQLFFNAVATATAWELGSADVGPVTTPFFHTGGWNVFAIPLWYRGGRVVLFDRFDPETLLDGLAEEGCTAALTVPTQLIMLQESRTWGRPLPRLKSFWAGGAPCPVGVAERTRAAGYGLREGYGLTECGPNCFVISEEESRRRPGWVGRPMAYLSMRLVRDDGTEAGDEEPGELLLRGPQMFSGYLNDPVRTAEAVTEDGWLRTGDLALRDATGLHRICGRKKEMYISGGENVYPAEVEAAICDCEGVAEVAVIGVPDAKWGEVGRAFVVARSGHAVTEEAVIARARRGLAGYKVPRSVVLVDALPRLGSGKVDRAALARETET
jgi:fatty-acyl-CoA synthase